MVGSAEQTPADGSRELVEETGADAYTPVKFGLSGCHDTTLAGVLTSLGAFDGDEWPAFTSHIAIELFKESGSAPTAEKAAVPVRRRSPAG